MDVRLRSHSVGLTLKATILFGMAIIDQVRHNFVCKTTCQIPTSEQALNQRKKSVGANLDITFFTILRYQGLYGGGILTHTLSQ